MASDNRITCINLGSQHIAGAVFGLLPGGGIELQKLERTELLGDPSADDRRASQVKMAAAEVASALGTKGGDVKYSIPSQSVFIRSVTLPPLDEEQVDQIVEFEAQQQVPFPINEAAWGYQLMADEDDVEMEVLLAAIKLDEIDEIDDAIRSAGLKGGGAEVAPISVFNAFRYNYPDLEGATLIIDIGARSTNLIYTEGGKCFIRNVKVGGADITKAIAKEFSIEFQDAEQRKLTDGFVALGGPYADHEDPVVAGMSKVIRNSLTRLHSEIMRTTNFYRSQQGGSAPELALLSGSTAGLPFIREFFAEKLNLPIDYFNALRNVKLGKGADEAMATGMAHSLGELVGCALSSAGTCPIEIELIPSAVKSSRAMHKRKPALMIATAVAVVGFLATGVFAMKAAEMAQDNRSNLTDKAEDLKEIDSQIAEARESLDEVSSKMAPYGKVVLQRAIWVGLLNDLNRRLPDETLWVTEFEPMAGDPPSPVMATGEESAYQPQGQQDDSSQLITAFRVSGLYRDSNAVVNQYLEALRESPYFQLTDVPSTDITLRNDAKPGVDGVGRWSFLLPLPEDFRIQYTK